VLFVDADASKEKEESAAHVADDARDLCHGRGSTTPSSRWSKGMEAVRSEMRRRVMAVVVQIRLPPPRSGAATATQ
jgi:hypothetical protein